jgi:hypothetical protein
MLCVVLGFQPDDLPFQIGVAVFGLLLSGPWLTTSWHSYRIIRLLYLKCEDDMPYDLKDLVYRGPVRFHPNTVFGFLVPILVIGGWLAHVAWRLPSV